MPFRLAIFILIVSTPLLAGQSSSSRAAPKADAVTAIIEAFGTSPVVALGEGDHGNEQGHAFRLGLIRDPRFAATVNDIVVESGNALYQDVMDRYVTGADVSSSELRLTWQNTTQLRPVWDVPIYEELFRAVREINTSLPAGRRLRVLLGDPPIDWKGVRTFADILRQMRSVGDRDTYPAALIQREVLAKQRRALIIYGNQHLTRTPPEMRPGCQPGSTIPCFPGSIADQLEKASGRRAFTVTTVTGIDLRTLEPDAATLRSEPCGAAWYHPGRKAIPVVHAPRTVDDRPRRQTPAGAAGCPTTDSQCVRRRPLRWTSVGDHLLPRVAGTMRRCRVRHDAP
jgi:hypothetical protein